MRTKLPWYGRHPTLVDKRRTLRSMRWFALVLLVLLCAFPMGALETRVMLGVDVLMHVADVFVFPMGVLEWTAATPPLGGWFHLEGGLRFRTLVLLNGCDLVLRSAIRLPRMMIGVECSPTVFLGGSDGGGETWILGLDAAVFMRLRMRMRERQRIAREFHLSVGADYLRWEDDDATGSTWFFPVRLGVIWRFPPVTRVR